MTAEYRITLEQLLAARDERAERQKKLIEEYKAPLISFTVNMPGICKQTPVSGKIFREGYGMLIKKLTEKESRIAYRETHDLITGAEAYVVVETDEHILKGYVIEIENQHPLGRLFDLDVIGPDGNAVSREDLGYPKRKCLLCDQDAHACTRSRRHSIQELTDRIQTMTDDYFNG